MSRFYDAPKVDAIFQQCLDWSENGCNDQYSVSEAKIEQLRITKCPFDPSVCLKGHKSAQITHNNITAFEVGINSRLDMSISHRLTCSPLDLSRLMLHGWKGSAMTLSNVNLYNATEIWANFSLGLETLDGPNEEYPDENPGYKAATGEAWRDINVLPSYWASEEPHLRPEYLHPEFRRRDGDAFVVLYRAGRGGIYNTVVDNRCSRHTTTSRKEMRTSVRFPREFCTGWGPAEVDEVGVSKLITGRLRFDDLQFEQLVYLFLQIKMWFSVYEYLSPRTQFFNMVPVKTRLLSNGITILGANKMDLWVEEVETWFQKAILNGPLHARNSARFHSAGLYRFVEGPYTEANSLCGRILFRHADSTNLYVVGLATTCVWLLFV
ncbi:hypothetical protein B0J13DRAFT_528734 [Dactylonectria estremocensis]|uniref:Uncharacterized protein n=1 Tax=Dactylonectria estremocensis TaxID=1079267 RepID=A0A9P9IXJ3_9HYPO|nr:hypothetical protein B0J13DRAFT_528734 [Dactylonectria estremocensis]